MNQSDIKQEIVAQIGRLLVNLLKFYRYEPDESDEIDIDEPYYYMEQEN